ncbi:MAG: PH domain-containing protein [Actinobacteria bacterium]|nr:PH domain-containing protein [Actinomycetota bacterium]
MRSRPRFLFEGEEVILNTRLHLRALLKPITVGAALVALAAAARWLYPGSPLDGLQIPEALLSLLLPERLGVRNFVRPDLWPLAAGGVLVLYALYLLTRIVRWRRHRVVVTTHRLIETSGVFGRRVSSVALANISDHRFRRSIPGRLFGYGQVVVSAAGRRHSIGPLPRRRRVDEAIAAALTPSSPVHSDKRVNRPSTRKYTAPPEPVRPAQGTRRAAPLQSVGKREVATPLGAQRVFDGRYVLVSRIAAGGMGTVYEGMDNRLRRSVARDVKPANVIVDDLGGVKVTDFGIARAIGDERMTATGIALGSAPYMSPEQVRGRGVGPRSDIYSAGIPCMRCSAAPRHSTVLQSSTWPSAESSKVCLCPPSATRPCPPRWTKLWRRQPRATPRTDGHRPETWPRRCRPWTEWNPSEAGDPDGALAHPKKSTHHPCSLNGSKASRRNPAFTCMGPRHLDDDDSSSAVAISPALGAPQQFCRCDVVDGCHGKP